MERYDGAHLKKRPTLEENLRYRAAAIKMRLRGCPYSIGAIVTILREYHAL